MWKFLQENEENKRSFWRVDDLSTTRLELNIKCGQTESRMIWIERGNSINPHMGGPPIVFSNRLFADQIQPLTVIADFLPPPESMRNSGDVKFHKHPLAMYCYGPINTTPLFVNVLTPDEWVYVLEKKDFALGLFLFSVKQAFYKQNAFVWIWNVIN